MPGMGAFLRDFFLNGKRPAQKPVEKAQPMDRDEREALERAVQMTVREREKLLLDMMESAWKLFREYCPAGYHLSMFATEDGYSVMGYTRRSVKHLSVEDLILDGIKTADGHYRFNTWKNEEEPPEVEVEA